MKPYRRKPGEKPGGAKTNGHAPVERVAELRFYEELNDFLPAERRKVSFRQPFRGTPAVRDLIQAVGVPHTAVDLILVDGRSVDFSHHLRGGERVAVYPVFERLDIGPVTHLRPRPLRRTRFIADVHLGRLARDLRMLGFDTRYAPDWDDSEIIALALAERRIILTRDVGLLKQKRVTHGYWLRSELPDRQLEELLAALDLGSQVDPFSRCIECNHSIETVARDTIRARVEPAVFERFDRFLQCRGCRRVYWQGSHYDRMRERLARLLPEHGEA